MSSKSRNNKLISSFLIVLLSFLMSFVLIIPASNYCITAEAIPDNNSSNSSSSNGNGLDLEPVDAEDVFGGGVTARDETGYADTINNFGIKVAKFIINTCVFLFAVFFTVVFAVDCVIIPFPPLAKFFAEVVPVQLFSQEAAAITGVAYSHGGNKGGGATPPPASGNNNGQTSLMGKYIEYAKTRTITLVFTGLLMVLTYSGLLQDLLNFAINTIVKLITG